jgi:hypothetical protein
MALRLESDNDEICTPIEPRDPLISNNEIYNLKENINHIIVRASDSTSVHIIFSDQRSIAPSSISLGQ